MTGTTTTLDQHPAGPIPAAAPDDPTLYGALDTADPDLELAVAEQLEMRFLTALIWAPTELATKVVTALIGSTTTRDNPDPTTTTVIPTTAHLLYQPTTQGLFAAVVDLLDEAVPLSPELIYARLASRGRVGEHTRNALLTVISPPGSTTLPGSPELPHLAAALIDTWYRRGYRALTRRMAQIAETAHIDELAGHHTTLTDHQHRAEARRLTIRDNLARL